MNPAPSAGTARKPQAGRRGTGSPGARARWIRAAAVAVPLAAPASAAPPPAGFADLVSGLLPAVVNISTRTEGGAREEPGTRAFPNPFPPGSDLNELFRRFMDRPPQRPSGSQGSGFIVSDSGYVVTNNHVVDEADEIAVTLQDETRLIAEVVGRDPKTDLALLKVDAGRNLPVVRFGDSSRLRVGDWVLAIGNPFGLGGTVTAGIVSGRQRDHETGAYDDFLQTDASINQGNSGGPLFNSVGEVVGINTAILAPMGHSVGVGFAIPSNLARPILDQLRKFGKARRGWLGVQIQTVTEDIAEAMGLPRAEGALVNAVVPGAPAEKHGIRRGDVILRFDGKEVGRMRRLPRLVAETAAGKAVSVEVWRESGQERLMVVLGERPENEALAAARPAEAPERVEVEALGLTVSALTPELRRRYDIDDDERGVVVTEVRGDGPAAGKAIQPGTIIRRMGSGHRVVERPSEVAREVERAVATNQAAVLLYVETSGTQRFVAIDLGRG